MTSVQDGAFYGWPYSYYGANVDERAQPPRPDLVAKAIKPDYALGSHVAAAAAKGESVATRLDAFALPWPCGWLLGHEGQGVAVGLGNLVIIGVDLAEREEAMAIAAVVDERRLQRRFDPRDLG